MTTENTLEFKKSNYTISFYFSANGKLQICKKYKQKEDESENERVGLRNEEILMLKSFLDSI